MKNVFGIAIRATIVTLVLTGLIYPFVMTGLAQVLFPWRANGSLVTDEKGQVVGSELIAQGFANPAYFQPGRRRRGRRAMTRPLRPVPISGRRRRSCRIASRTISNG